MIRIFIGTYLPKTSLIFLFKILNINTKIKCSSKLSVNNFLQANETFYQHFTHYFSRHFDGLEKFVTYLTWSSAEIPMCLAANAKYLLSSMAPWRQLILYFLVNPDFFRYRYNFIIYVAYKVVYPKKLLKDRKFLGFKRV